MKRFLQEQFIWLWLVICGCGLVAWALSLRANFYVSVEWTTASELDTAGFLIGRSEAPGGPFQVITDHLIGASETPLTGGSYSFRDHTVEPGKTYFYELHEVELNGEQKRLSVVSVTATDDSVKVGLIGAGLILSGASVIMIRSARAKGLRG